MAEERVLVVARLRARAGWVELEDGKKHEIFPTNGETYQALRAAPREKAVELVYEAVEKCVPSATRAEILKLDLVQANAVLAIAGAGIDQVEQLYPNAVSPATSTSPG